MTKTYFKFDLPKEKGYSPNWCGSVYMGNIKNPKVLFYDEQEGYGVASCETPENELDKNLTPITEKEALSLLAKTGEKDYLDKVYVGNEIKLKWNKKPYEAPYQPLEMFTAKADMEESDGR